MVKKCVVCNENAEFKIKDTSDYYCKDCAEENFSDVSMLIKVEEEAQKLKEFLRQKIDDIKHDEEELDTMITFTEKKHDKHDTKTGKD
ncbi:hypothetical protein COV17_00450 [Candidatus Woesearchaeota archaeon CG10_big_fil_rev_8_21_14_0_10_36_11]|nr:MAG: hypothetical protein COV17_00450 [Candidatus Woesearchaeota archaeon CG10_big_fil_rev_8_21_14_0_10_36_11]